MSRGTFAETAGEWLDALPDSAVVLDAEARIVAVNRAWRRFAAENGAETDDVGIGRSYLEICDSDAPGVARRIREVLAGVADRHVIEYPCHAPDEDRWFRLSVTPFRDGALVVHVDITPEFNRISRWLAGTDIAIIELGPDLSANFVNESWRRIVGPDAWTSAIHPDDVDALHRQLAHCLMDRRPFATEVRVGAGWFRLAAHVETDDDAAVTGVVLVGTDISIESASIAQKAAAEERHRLAAELHDTVVQRLYASALALQRAVAQGQAGAELLEDTIDRLDHAIADLRSLNRPDPAAPENLLAAIDTVLADAEAALGFRLRAAADLGPDTPGPAMATNLLAVLTEALSNVARHSGASTCRVRIVATADRLVLTVVDNGRGMPAEPARTSGTANIRRRAEELGGRAIWSDAPGGGTVLTWQVRLAEPAAEDEVLTITAR